MAGAIAGSAILETTGATRALRVVTVTVNNQCNLDCPHCYLQYEGPGDWITDEAVAAVVACGAVHVAIVGKEPLVNRRTALRVAGLIRQIRDSGKSVSIITNGFGLRWLDDEALQQLKYVDLSLDGGPLTYAKYRGGTFSVLARLAADVRRRGLRSLRILNVLNSATLSCLDDLVDASRLIGPDLTLFSPFISTRNAGSNSVAAVPLSEVLRVLASSTSWRGLKRAWIMIDEFHVAQAGLNWESVVSQLTREHMLKKAFLIRRDPIEHGILRVTYDGFVLSPSASLHPNDYRSVGVSLVNAAAGTSLSELFDNLRFSVKTAA